MLISTKEDLARIIDQTLLKPDATEEDVRRFCREAARHNFASVFVNPFYTDLAFRLLEDSSVRVGTTVGFPLGASTSAVKCFEARDAIERGAREIDMVLNIGALKSGNVDAVQRDIYGVMGAIREKEIEGEVGPITVKVIIEACYLTDEEKRIACRVIEEAGADFVKTSTGLGPGGATVHDVRLLRKYLRSKVGVKASGGIRTLEQCLEMLKAGANRIGTSSGVEIMKEFEDLPASARRWTSARTFG
ncbi:MAG TPA: deoxyribose-phosphate aldolase [Actinobacteria bacterium]|nr:deoxyribose-phosphate aldolase [Actinomycetota bacterium]